jgi:hypothetical protein
MTKNMLGTIGNTMVGTAGTVITASLAHANEWLAFTSGVLTISFMTIKLWRLVKKTFFAAEPKQTKKRQSETTTV